MLPAASLLSRLYSYVKEKGDVLGVFGCVAPSSYTTYTILYNRVVVPQKQSTFKVEANCARPHMFRYFTRRAGNNQHPIYPLKSK